MATVNFTITDEQFTLLKDSVSLGTWDKRDEVDEKFDIVYGDNAATITLYDPYYSFILRASDTIQIGGVGLTGTFKDKLETLKDEVFYLERAAGEATTVAVLELKTTLTHAQILDMDATPIQVVPAPGANKILYYHGGAIVTKFTGTAYGNINGSGSGPYIVEEQQLNALNANPDALWVLEVNDGPTYVDLPPAAVQRGNYASTFINKAFLVRAENAGGGPFTGGDSSNTMEVTVYYSIIDLA